VIIRSECSSARETRKAERDLAAQFKRTKTTKGIGEVLASLARLGYATTQDGETFKLRRAA
jgi:DNA-binding FadR family transcriptional regulator